MKEPWATPNGATHKTCNPFQKKRDNSRKKNIKTSKKSKKYSKIQKIKKNLEKLQKTLKNTRKRKREWSGSEAAGKKTIENREKTLKSSNPLRSRFVPAPFPLQARGVLTLPWSFQCLGAKGCCHGKITRKHASCIKVNLRTKKFTKLLPPKNLHETLGVLTLPWSFQYISIYIYVCMYINIYMYV